LKNWVEELKSKGPKEIALAIAGNKADLESERVLNFFILEFFLFIFYMLLCFLLFFYLT
jgi:GTPase SAR1 family protein